MNTKRLFLSRSLLITLLASTLAIGTAAYASPGGGKHWCGMHGGKPAAEMMQKRLDRMAKKLELSVEQKQQLKVLFDNKRMNREAHKAERKALREQRSLLEPTANNYDQKLAEYANTKSELVRQKTIARGQVRKQMAQILTPEQQVKMKELRKRKHRKGGFRHGHGKRFGENQS